jgi:hypothetical protein
MGGLDDLGGVAGEISDCLFDLAEGDLHVFSVKPGCAEALAASPLAALRFQRRGRSEYNPDRRRPLAKRTREKTVPTRRMRRRANLSDQGVTPGIPSGSLYARRGSMGRRGEASRMEL